MLTNPRKGARTDIDGVLALIGLISDAKGCESRLSELTAAADRADEAEQKAVAAQKAAYAAAQAAQERSAADLARDIERSDQLAAREKDVAATEAVMKQKAAELAERGNKLAAWTNDLDARDAAAKLRDVEIAEREAKQASAEKAAAALRAEYEKKLEKLRTLAGA